MSNWDTSDLRAAKLQVYAEESTCFFCGRHVDAALSIANPQHNAARSVHHVLERALGGTDDRANLRLAHRICNTMGKGVPELLNTPGVGAARSSSRPTAARFGAPEKHSEAWGHDVPPPYVF